MLYASVLTVLLVLALCTLVVGLLWAALVPRRKKARDVSPANENYGRPFLGGQTEVPFHLRRITLKVCPECRELVTIEATACKYCGTAQPAPEVKTAAEAADVVLALPRKKPDR